MPNEADPVRRDVPAGETVRVYIDGKSVDVPFGAPVLDALGTLDAALADAVRGGQRAFTDSRGLPVTPDTPVHGGAIFRVVSARAARSAAPDDAAH